MGSLNTLTASATVPLAATRIAAVVARKPQKFALRFVMNEGPAESPTQARNNARPAVPMMAGTSMPSAPKINATISTPDVPNLTPAKLIRPKAYPSTKVKKIMNTVLPLNP